jgi:hypothetical protein
MFNLISQSVSVYLLIVATEDAVAFCLSAQIYPAVTIWTVPRSLVGERGKALFWGNGS